MTTERKSELMKNLIVLIEETLFTKLSELEFANFQKLADKTGGWDVFAQKNKAEADILEAKLKFYTAKLGKMNDESKTGSDTESGQ